MQEAYEISRQNAKRSAESGKRNYDNKVKNSNCVGEGRQRPCQKHDSQGQQLITHPGTSLCLMDLKQQRLSGGILCQVSTTNQCHPMGIESNSKHTLIYFMDCLEKIKTHSITHFMDSLEENRKCSYTHSVDWRGHTLVSTLVELRWSRSTVSGFWESTSQRTYHDHHTSPPWLKKQKRLCFLRKLKKAKCQSQTLISFYRGAIGSILTGNITIWHSLCTAQDRKALQQGIKTTQDIVGTHLPSISDIGEVRCLHKAQRIVKTTPTPATGCSHCYHLEEDTEVPIAVPPDCGVASSLRL